LNKVDPSEVEKLLKYGVYAFLDEEEGSENAQNSNAIKIEDILKNKGGKRGGIQKTSFNVDSGKNSTKKGVKINDPNFWEKVLPFEGYNSKQLLRKFKQKRAEIV
jgi:hypothetical protein